MSWAYVDERFRTVFVLDEYAETVFEEIIGHDEPRLAAAETVLASFGWRRTSDWEQSVNSHWTAEVERT